MAFGAVLALSACGGGGGDDAMKFEGPWTFDSGELAAMCGAGFPTPAPFPLAGLPVTITKVSNSAFDLAAGPGTKCTVHFNVSGNKATAQPNQSCILNVGSFGEQTITVQSWTLALSSDHLDSTTSGIVLVCTLSGSGVLVRGAPDAGAD